jgi:AcrR family transcriptional regulator
VYDRGVARWTPGTRGRLQAAAFELFAEKGFERTTVGEIAARVGVMERTFYRYFADKREVFFDGGQDLQDFLVRAVEASPADLAPLDAIAAALCRAAREVFAERLVMARQRQALIEAHPELQERELAKMAGLVTALAATLRARGVEELAASVAAEAGLAIFRIAFARWVDQQDAVTLDVLITSALRELRLLAAPGKPSPSAPIRRPDLDPGSERPLTRKNTDD